MRQYMLCRLIHGEVFSPKRHFSYGVETELFGKKLIYDVDNPDKTWIHRLGVTNAEGLIYRLNEGKDYTTYEVEVTGKAICRRGKYEQQYSETTFIRRLSDEEVKDVVRKQSDEMGWNYYEACFPRNPKEINVPFDQQKAFTLLKEWASTVDFYQNVIRNSVRYSIQHSVGHRMEHFVKNSIESSVVYVLRRSLAKYSVDTHSVGYLSRAYISSFFPNIKKWELIDHIEGTNPFQSGIDLWNLGLVPSYDNETWRLHKGKNMKVVFEISKKDLDIAEYQKNIQA